MRGLTASFKASQARSISALDALARPATELVFKALASGKKAVANPWGEGATTLEWTVSSPPPFHTFGDKVPKT